MMPRSPQAMPQRPMPVSKMLYARPVMTPNPRGIITPSQAGAAGIGVAADDLGDVSFLPSHDLGDHALGYPEDAEFRDGRSPQIVEMQVAFFSMPTAR